MYRKPKFLEILHDIREQMSREVDYDVELFAEMVRSGRTPARSNEEARRHVMEVVPTVKPAKHKASGRTVRDAARELKNRRAAS